MPTSPRPKLARRTWMLQTALAVTPALACLMPLGSHAQTFPSKTVTLVLPAATGGTTDIAARMLAPALGTALGQSVVVDNKSGGNGAIAAQLVKRADPDGHTLLMQYSGYHVITPLVSKSPLGWELSDLQPVANVISAPQLILVRSSLPIHTLAELIAYAKANPGKLNYATSGNGSLQHVTGAMLEQQTGIQMTAIPYRSSGLALTDLLGNQVDLTFGTPPPYVPHILSGKLRALAVTGKTRLPSLPDVPTATQAGLPGLDASSWFGVFAPAKTPKVVVDKLSAEIAKITATTAFKQRAIDLGAEADYMNPQQLGELVKQEVSRWTQVVKAAKIEAD